MIFVGVDPGKLGGIAALDEHGALLWVRPMPLIPSVGGRPHYDLAALTALMVECRETSAFVTVERLSAMPAKLGGGIANFQRGVSQGWEWLLAALQIPCHFVRPATWQRVMLDGAPGRATQQRAIIAAQRLFPGVDLRRTPRAHRAHDGLADALLIAEYGRRGREARKIS